MVGIGEVRHLEAELEQKRRVIAAALAAERAKRELSLRDVGRSVRLVPSAVLKIERGESWKTETVARLVKYYERTESKTASQAPTPS